MFHFARIDKKQQRRDAPTPNRFAIMDEADRMLSVGFEEDVERILENAPKDRQTLLFSATMPMWVKKLTRRFQKAPVTVDLVGDEEAGKMAESIRWGCLFLFCLFVFLLQWVLKHFSLPGVVCKLRITADYLGWFCSWPRSSHAMSIPSGMISARCMSRRLLGVQVHHEARLSVLVDLLTVHAAGGKAIVFANTKRDADEVSAAIAQTTPTEVRPPVYAGIKVLTYALTSSTSGVRRPTCTFRNARTFHPSLAGSRRMVQPLLSRRRVCTRSSSGAGCAAVGS